MAKKKVKVKVTRDAKTGEFVKAGTETKRPSTTVRETVVKQVEIQNPVEPAP